MADTHIIYVPGAGDDFGIATGSGIVANIEQESSDRVIVYYEGNLYGAENMRRLEERIYHAASRQVARYPTIAKMALPRNGLVEVGRFDYAARRVTSISAPDALAAWVPDEAEWISSVLPG